MSAFDVGISNWELNGRVVLFEQQSCYLGLAQAKSAVQEEAGLDLSVSSARVS